MRPRPVSFSLPLAAFLVASALVAVLPWLPAAEDNAAPGLVATMKGHREAVYSVAFTPDGKHVVSGSGDSTLKVWDSATGKEIKNFGGPAGHKNLVMSVSVSPDGNLIASGGTDNTAKLWDFPSSGPLRALAKSEGANVVAVSPDGAKLAGGDKDGHVKIWNSADGKELFQFTGHIGPVTDLAFSGNGQLLISCGKDKTLRFWNPANGQSLGVIGAHATEVRGLAVHPNNNALYSAGADGSLKFWTLPPVVSKVLGAVQGDAVTALALSGDGNSFVSSSSDKSVRLANATNGQVIREFKGANAGVESVALSPNGALIAAGTADKRLLVWQAKEGQLLSNVASSAAGSVAFHPGSNQLLTGGSDGSLKLWAVPPIPERTLTHPDAVRSAVVSADGKNLFSGGADKIVRAWNLSDTRMPQRQFSGHGAAVNAVAQSADGKLLASAGDDDTIRFWNQSNGEQTALIGAHSGPVTSLAFHSGGQVLSASADGSVKLWQPPAAGKLLAHPGQVTSAVLSPDGSRLVTGCSDKQVRLWNVSNGQVERPFAGPSLGVLCVAMNPAGTQVAAGSADKTLFVWNAADAKEIKKFTLAASVNSVAFSPDGKFLAGGLADNSIHLFDLAMGKEIKTLSGHSGAINGLMFASKGERLVSASADKTVQIWNIADGKSTVKLEHGAAVQALALNKDGTHIASGGTDKSVKVWTLSGHTTIATPSEVRSVSFSPDGSRLLVGGADNKARVYDIDGQLVEFFPHEGAVQAVAFHGDGKRVFTASADKTVRMWPLSLLWQARHTGPVRQALFTGRGDRVLSCGDDKTIKIWNAADCKLVKSLDAHAGPITAIAINSDATRIISCSADKTVKIFNLPAKSGDNEEKPLVISLPAAASAVALSPNGRFIAAPVSEAQKARVHVFDANGKELLVSAEQAGPISSVSFLADNRTLVSASADKTVRLSDVNILASFDAHAGGVTSVAFHNNGTLALSGGADKTVKLWDATKGQVVKTFGPLPQAVRAVAFNRAGTQIAAAAGRTAVLWDIADGKEASRLEHSAEVAGLSFSADGTRLATGTVDNEVRVWELASGRELQAFLHAGPVRAVAFHPSNNAILFSGSADKTVAAHTMSVTRVLSAGAPVHAVTITANGSHIVTAGDDGKIKLWNAGNGANERTLEGGGKGVHALAVSKNNVFLAAGCGDGVVRVFTLNDGKLLAEIKAPGVVRHLALAPNSQMLAAACAQAEGAGVLQTWNVAFNPGQAAPAEFGKPVQTYASAGAVGGIVFDTKGSIFYSGSTDKPIQAWKLAADAPVKNFQHPNLVDVVSFNPAGTQLATGCHDGRLRIFDVAKGTVLREIQAHVTAPQPSAIYCLAWSSDGKQIVSGSYDHSLKLWNAADGKLIREFKRYEEKKFEKGHRDSVVTAALAPDGKTLASGDWDRAIKIWNVADGNVLRELANPQLKAVGATPQSPQGHPGVVYALRYTLDGTRLISAGAAPRLRGYLAIWNVSDGKMLYGGEQSLGTLFSLAVSADGKYLAVGSGGSSAGGEEGSKNNVYVMKLPAK